MCAVGLPPPQYSGNESSCNLQHFGIYNVTIGGRDGNQVAIAEKIITFQMDNKSITKHEMKVRSMNTKGSK